MDQGTPLHVPRKGRGLAGQTSCSSCTLCFSGESCVLETFLSVLLRDHRVQLLKWHEKPVVDFRVFFPEGRMLLVCRHTLYHFIFSRNRKCCFSKAGVGAPQIGWPASHIPHLSFTLVAVFLTSSHCNHAST